MFQRIEDTAYMSVGRGCGFAALGIITFVVGLSGEMQTAFQAGGLASLFVCLLLMFKARHAHLRPYKHTEVWLLLEPVDRPQSNVAQLIISSALRDAYLFFAQHAAWAAVVMFVASIFVGLFFTSEPPAL